MTIVKVEYEGSFENGEIFDSSQHGEHSHPLRFEVGAGQVVSGFDKAVIGMKKGEEKKFEIAPEEAYGEYDSSLKKEIPRSEIPLKQELEKGMILIMGTPEGERFPVKILDVDKNKVVIDLNHPLAGKKLIFKIKIVDVESV